MAAVAIEGDGGLGATVRPLSEGGAAPSSLDHWFDNAAGGRLPLHRGRPLVTLRTKRLTAKSVRNCMLLAAEWVNLVGGGQDIQGQYMPPKLAKIRVQLGSRDANKRWAAKYRKIFTSENTGGYKVRVVAARAPSVTAVQGFGASILS